VSAVEEVVRPDLDLLIHPSTARNVAMVDDRPAAVSECVQDCFCIAHRGPLPAGTNCGSNEQTAQEDGRQRES
jgi:hypothetical protein